MKRFCWWAFTNLVFFIFLCGQLVSAEATLTNKVASETQIDDLFKQEIKLEGRRIGVREFLFELAERNNWALIISQDVRSQNKRIRGKNLKEILKNYFDAGNISWRFFDNCLYVARKDTLDYFFKNISIMELGLPKGNNQATFNGEFENIDIGMLCSMLSSISNLDIRCESRLRAGVMMRALNMPWQRVLVSLIYLNRFRMIRGEYSVIIAPEEL